MGILYVYDFSLPRCATRHDVTIAIYPRPIRGLVLSDDVLFPCVSGEKTLRCLEIKERLMKYF